MDKQVKITVNGQVRLSGQEQVAAAAQDVVRSQNEMSDAAQETAAIVDGSFVRSGEAVKGYASELETLKEALAALNDDKPQLSTDLTQQVARSAVQTNNVELAGMVETVQSAQKGALSVDAALEALEPSRAPDKEHPLFEDSGLEPREFPRRETHSAPPSAENSKGPSTDTLLRQAAKRFSAVEANIDAGFDNNSQVKNTERSLKMAGSYMDQAIRDGGLSDEAERLGERFKELSEKFEEGKAAFETSPGPQPREPGSDNPVMQELLQSLKGLAGAGLGQFGMLGRVAGRLGPVGLAAGAVVGGFTLADRMISGANRDARAELTASSDLARQYGTDQNPMGIFRGAGAFSDPELLELGYTGTDAGRVASVMDSPGGFRGDTISALELARSSGLDEDNVGRAVGTLGKSGAAVRGEAGLSLDVLKLAMTEGLKDGVSQSDTFQTLVSLGEQQLQQGVSSTLDGLAFQAALQQRLADTGERSLQGSAGMNAQQALMNSLTGGGNAGLELMQVQPLIGMSADELGLTGAEAGGYEKLREESPMAAAQAALELANSGKLPEVTKLLAANMENLTGGSAYIQSEMLGDSVGASQKLGIIDGGGYDMVTQAADNTATYKEGQSRRDDVQGANKINNDSLQLDAMKADMKIVNSMSSLKITGGVEAEILSVKSLIVQGKAALSDEFGTYGLEDNNAGEVGEGASAIPSNLLPHDPSKPTGEGREDLFAPITEAALSAVGTTVAGSGEHSHQDIDEIKDYMGKIGYGVQTSEPNEDHSGMDFVVDDGVVKNPFPGQSRIKETGFEEDGLGNYVKLELPSGNVMTMGHFDEDMSHRAGDKLFAGDEIGPQGSTGKSTGDHVHMHYDGQRELNRDPDKFYEQLERDFNFHDPNPLDGEGAAPAKQEIVVRFEGLDNIQVTGASPEISSDVSAAVQQLARAVARTPQNVRGRGISG